jgi:molecular chaperone Hsp33
MHKRIYGATQREQLIASKRDRMVQFLLAGGTVRGALLCGTKMVNEMRSNHRLGVLETLVLGHAYMGTLLLSSSAKGADRVIIRIESEGPMRGLSVEANAFGEVRGFLFQVPIPVDRPVESFDLAPFFGSGVLGVTRHIEGARRPFSSRVSLRHGNIAQDLAHFSMLSEQIPSAFNLSVKFDAGGVPTGAGGLMLQAMPDADDATRQGLQRTVERLPSIGGSLAAGADVHEMMAAFADYAPETLGERRIEFMCHCSSNRFGRFLSALPAEDRQDIAANGPFPLTLTCHNCGTEYSFSRRRLASILS